MRNFGLFWAIFEEEWLRFSLIEKFAWLLFLNNTLALITLMQLLFFL